MPTYNYQDLTPEVVMNLFLYGQTTRPASLMDDSLLRPANQDSIVFVDAVSFMTDGPGRFINPSMSTLVQNFFSSTNTALSADGARHEYSIADMKAIVSGDEKIAIQ